MKSGIRRVAAVIMTVMLLTALGAVSVSASSVQQYSHGKLSRFNIQIVIDGSGSLVTGKDATDPSGLRYDAINLFLALLTNEGNDVGAIVFDVFHFQGCSNFNAVFVELMFKRHLEAFHMSF